MVRRVSFLTQVKIPLATAKREKSKDSQSHFFMSSVQPKSMK